MRQIITDILSILYTSAPYLLVGFALAGVLHVVLNRFPRATEVMTGTGRKPIFLAAVLGLPMPLCSCGVLPAAIALRNKGASKGATSSFLISVPETDVISIILTFALMGPVLAIYRPVAALVTAIVTGLVISWIEMRAHTAHESSDASTNLANEAHCDHCHNETETDTSPQPNPEAKESWVRTALRYGFVEMFDDIVAQLLLGVVIAGVIVAVLPEVQLSGIKGGSAATYLVMLLIGIPVYVCATASTPIAAGLIAGGLSPGAAMVFLLAGPATNIASVVVLIKQFGRAILVTYFICIAIITVLFGVGLDVMLGSSLALPAPEVEHAHDHTTAFEIACAVAFLLLAAWSFRRTGVLGRTVRRIVKKL